MTRFQQHCAKWKRGCGSEHCASAFRICLFRGKRIPCDILFIGEAPGPSENSRGVPFDGKSGQDLDAVVARAVPAKYSCGFTNIAGCFPRDETGKKLDPSLEQIEQCSPRLEELVAIANPRLIVAVGKIAKDNLAAGYAHSYEFADRIPIIHIMHPSWVERQPVANRGLEFQRMELAIKDAVDEFLEHTPEAPRPEGEEFVKLERHRVKVASRVISRPLTDRKRSGSIKNRAKPPSSPWMTDEELRALGDEDNIPF